MFEVEYALAWTWRHDRDERGLQLYAELTLRLEEQHERYSYVRNGFPEKEIRKRTLMMAWMNDIKVKLWSII